MKKIIPVEFWVLILAIAILFRIIDPLSQMFSDSILLIATLIIIAALSFFAFFLWKPSGDERDSYHMIISGRIGYVVGLTVLLLGAMYDVFSHRNTHPVILIALGAMLISKLGVLLWSRRYK